MATIEEFHAIEMKVGTILVAEYIEGADKLLRLEVDFGPKPQVETVAAVEGESPEATPLSASEIPPQTEVRDVRQILSGIRAYYEPEALVGKQCPFVVNLPVRTMRGLESHGMILAVGTADGIALLHPDHVVLPGSELR